MNHNASASSITIASGQGKSDQRNLSVGEWGTLLCVAFPIVILATLLVVDKLQTDAARTQLRTYVAQLRDDGLPVDRLTLERRYDADRSKDQTLDWAPVLEADKAFQDEPQHGLDSARLYSMISPLVDEQGEKGDVEITEHELDLRVLDFITRRDAAITSARKDLLEADGFKRPVWFPSGVPENYYSRWSQNSLMNFLVDDIRYFQADIGHGRYQEAIEVLQRMLATNQQLDAYNSTRSQTPWVPDEIHGLVRASLAVADWNAEQLQQLRDMIQPTPDYADAYKSELVEQMASSLEAFDIDGGGQLIVHQGRFRQLPFEVPPQTILQWIDFMKEGEENGRPGTYAMLDANRWSWGKYPRNQQAEAMALTTFPLATATPLFRNSGAQTSLPLARLASYETNRRWVLTAVAIRQYQLKFKKWPAVLTDLQQVGLTRIDWEVMPGVSLGYQSSPLQGGPTTDVADDDEVVLWKPDVGHGNSRRVVVEFANGPEAKSPPRESPDSPTFDMTRIAVIRVNSIQSRTRD